MAEQKASGNPEALRHAFLLDGKGSGEQVTLESLERDDPAGRVAWIDLFYNHADAQAWVRAQRDIPPVVREAMLEKDSRPGMFEYEHGFLLILRGANMNEGARPEDMISLRVWVDDRRVITCRRRLLQSLRSVAHRLQKGDGPEHVGALLSDLIGELAQRINAVDQQLNSALAGIEIHSGTEAASKIEDALSSLRHRTAILRRYLAPQKEAMQRLHHYQGGLLQAQDRQELQMHADTMLQCLEDIDLVREQVMAMQDDMFNRLAMAQNARMYVLSIVAAIFLPMTFLTGLLGMNVGGIPLAVSPLGFLTISGLSIALAGLLLYLFKRRRWL